MNADEVLRQLLWKHEATLIGLAQELGGPGATCRLRDPGGAVTWDSQGGVGGTNGAATAQTAAWLTGTAPGAATAQPTGVATAQLTGTAPGAATSHAAGQQGAPHAVGWILPLAGVGCIEVRSPAVPVGAPIELPAMGRFLLGAMETEEELDRLVEDHIANTNQLVALYHIIAATHETWALADKLDVMLEEAGRQIGTSLAFLQVSHEDRHHLALWPGDEPFRRERADGLLVRCAKEMDAFIGDDPEPFVAAPILVRDQIVGWLGAGQRQVGDPLGQRDLKHVSALAELTAGFLQTARLQDQVVSNTKLQRELEIASQIQDMLMPKELPQVPGIAVAASCRPASSVGGDFFVVQKLEDGRLAFALGDVTGKGVPAALIMAMARTVFRSLTPLSVGADVVLARMSQVLYDDLEEVGKFVTLVLGLWDPERKNLQIANAGHSPVLYRPRRDAPLVYLEPLQPPLGVLPDPIGAPLDLEFGPGATFLACSDGVTEARDPNGGFYGDQRLLDLIAGMEQATAEELRKGILADVEEFADGAAQSDDQTILVLTYVHDAVSPEESPEAEGSWFCLAAVKGELPKVNAEIDRVLATVREMQPEVAPLRLVTSIGDEMKLAVHEAVANLIEHGGLGVDDEIGIRLCAGAEGIVAEIDSGGPPFDPAAVDPAPPEPEALLEGGYGLHLIHALTDSIEYEPGEDRHRLRLTRAWRAS